MRFLEKEVQIKSWGTCQCENELDALRENRRDGWCLRRRSHEKVDLLLEGKRKERSEAKCRYRVAFDMLLMLMMMTTKTLTKPTRPSHPSPPQTAHQ